MKDTKVPLLVGRGNVMDDCRFGKREKNKNLYTAVVVNITLLRLVALLDILSRLFSLIQVYYDC